MYSIILPNIVLHTCMCTLIYCTPQTMDSLKILLDEDGIEYSEIMFESSDNVTVLGDRLFVSVERCNVIPKRGSMVYTCSRYPTIPSCTWENMNWVEILVRFSFPGCPLRKFTLGHHYGPPLRAAITDCHYRPPLLTAITDCHYELPLRTAITGRHY